LKKLLLVILSISTAMLAGCGKMAEKSKYQASFLTLFDTITTIVGYSDSKEDFTALSQQIYDRLEYYHRLYDIYNDYDGINNIKTINDNAGKNPVKADAAIISMLEFSKECYEKTGGTVNVAMGAVLSIWHDYREDGLDDPENAKLPPMKLLEEASRHCSIDDVVIEADTVYLKDPLMRLDVGSVAKGYAVEQTVLYIESLGVDSLLLSVGGNVRAIGGKSAAKAGGETRWNVGIQNPDKSSPGSELLSVLIKDCSVISSGSYERYYTVNGIRYHHIIDPKTLMPSSYHTAVTIICGDSGTADALSTAVFNMPLSDGRSLVDSLENTEALWVMSDGALEYSSGFSEYVKKE